MTLSVKLGHDRLDKAISAYLYIGGELPNASEGAVAYLVVAAMLDEVNESIDDACDILKDIIDEADRIGKAMGLP